jgi:hypothetical protein
MQATRLSALPATVNRRRSRRSPVGVICCVNQVRISVVIKGAVEQDDKPGE